MTKRRRKEEKEEEKCSGDACKWKKVEREDKGGGEELCVVEEGRDAAVTNYFHKKREKYLDHKGRC